jgi:hypothetical protein
MTYRERLQRGPGIRLASGNSVTASNPPPTKMQAKQKPVARQR